MTTQPDLRAELLARADEDQVQRRRLVAFEGADGVARPHTAAQEQMLVELQRVDAENTAWMIDVVDRMGWPTRSIVGDDGADAAWLLVQHADRDADFQRRCLDLMLRLPAREVRRSHIAYLTDRVRLASGRPQVYGTQVQLRDGVAFPRELEDPDAVDDRRALMGLGPLADYLAGFGRA